MQMERKDRAMLATLRRVVIVCLAVAGWWTGAAAQAPPPADGPAYAVAYVDTSPTSREALATALKQYREASGAEGGFVRIDLLEQVGWPGHFAVVETWASRAALDAHASGPNARRLHDRIAPIRTTGYDERPYDAMFTAPLAGFPTAQAVYVVAHVDIGGGGLANAPPILRGQAEASRQEAGHLRFDVLQHATRRNHFTVFETWSSRAAHDAHAAAAHTKRYRETVQPLTGSPLDERIYTAID